MRISTQLSNVFLLLLAANSVNAGLVAGLVNGLSGTGSSGSETTSAAAASGTTTSPAPTSSATPESTTPATTSAVETTSTPSSTPTSSAPAEKTTSTPTSEAASTTSTTAAAVQTTSSTPDATTAPTSASSSTDKVAPSTTSAPVTSSTASMTIVPTTITSLVTSTKSDGSKFTSTAVYTSAVSATAALANDGTTKKSSGMSSSTRNAIIGVCVGVGGAALLGGLFFAAWRVWGRKRHGADGTEKDDLMGTAYGSLGSPARSELPATAFGRDDDPFKRTLESYHNPGSHNVNASSNF